MADFSVNETRPKGHAAQDRFEYRIYFALIFVFALPFAVLGYVWTVVRHARTPAQGPVARAWAEAQQVAPMIFRA